LLPFNTHRNSKSLLAAGFKGERFFAPNASENIQFVLGDHGLNGLLDTSYVNPAPPSVPLSVLQPTRTDFFFSRFHEFIISSLVKNGGHETLDNGGGLVDGIAHVTNARIPSNNTRATSVSLYLALS